MPRRRHNPERDVAGEEIFVRLGDGFVAIAPAALPSSSSALRFHRGRAPRLEGVPLVPTRAAGPD